MILYKRNDCTLIKSAVSQYDRHRSIKDLATFPAGALASEAAGIQCLHRTCLVEHFKL